MEDSQLLQVGYVDGCFDLMHSGHFNAILQAKSMCKKLVVGIHSNEEITKNKGPPVMTEEERYGMLSHLKWVDEVVYNVPYSPSIDILDKYQCEKAFHGDDMPVNSEGVGAYDVLRDAGRLQVFPRTEGLSTTDYIGRLMALANHGSSTQMTETEMGVERDDKTATTTLATQHIQMLQSTNRIIEFAQPYRSPRASDRIVYVDGSFDMFNIGHATTLMKAKALGSYLVVGLYSDQSVEKLKGAAPVSSLFERMLCVLACKYVDSVLMDVPVAVTQDLLTSLHVDVVAYGSHTRTNFFAYKNGSFEETGTVNTFTNPDGAYKIPRHKGMLIEIPSQYPELHVETFIERISSNREAFIRRNVERVGKEKKYYKEKNENAECS